MKNIFFTIALTSILLFACQKQTCEPTNRGTVINDGIINGCYWLEIKNRCTNNKKLFALMKAFG